MTHWSWLSSLALHWANFRQRLRDWWTHRRVWRRFYRLQAHDPEVRQHRVLPRNLRWIGQARGCVELWQRVFTCYSERTCLTWEGGSLTYGQLHQRLRPLPVTAGELVGIAGFGNQDWVVADLSCLWQGAVSVPLSDGVSDEDYLHVLRQTGLTCVLCETSALKERLQALKPEVRVLNLSELPPGELVATPRSSDNLFSVVYTSGSTGAPKGVTLTLGRWEETLRDALGRRPAARLTVGYLPLCHMAGRINLYATLMAGGRVHLSSGDILADFLIARPTHLLLIPRLSALIYQQFQTRYAAGGGQLASPARMLADPPGRAIAEAMRIDFLGGRLCFVATGAAPTPPEVAHFLKYGLLLQVTDVYGSTEMGPLTVNGSVHDYVEYKLIDRPELGFARTDQPYPRGELAVRTPRATLGYYNNPAASRALLDEDGFLLTGDLVEERRPRHLVWLDRRASVLKMSHGHFVNVSRLEEIYASESPLIEQIYLHGDSLRAQLMAVVVTPSGEDEVRAELQRVAGRLGLPAHEIPRDVIIETEPFSLANGLLSEAGKLRRPRLKERYGPRLEELYQALERRQVEGVSQSLWEAVAQVLGIDALQPGASSFQQLGGDSLSAVRLSHILQEQFSLSVPVSSLLDPATPLSHWLSTPASGHYQRIHADDRVLEARHLRADLVVGGQLVGGTVAPPPPARVVLVTGANGFLGRMVARQLVGRVKVIGLVRARDQDHAQARLGLAGVEAMAGDLTRERLGLSGAEFERLSREVDAIVHCGALVNHLLDYRDLFEPNVMGTAEVVRLAVARKRKAVHFISSVAVAAGTGKVVRESQLASQLWPRRPLQEGYAEGYASSKWAAEVLLEDVHHRTGLPITLSRCSMLLPHRQQPAVNQDDLFTRLMLGIRLTGLAPTTFYQTPGPHHYDGLPVDLVADFLTELTCRPRAGMHTYHISNSNWEDGVSLDRLVDWAGELWQLERIEYSQFLVRFEEKLRQLPLEQQRRSPLPILQRWHRPLTGATRLDTTAFARDLHDWCRVEHIPTLTRDYLHHCCRSLPP